jgi:hypothetical protein
MPPRTANGNGYVWLWRRNGYGGRDRRLLAYPKVRHVTPGTRTRPQHVRDHHAPSCGMILRHIQAEVVKDDPKPAALRKRQRVGRPLVRYFEGAGTSSRV